MSVQVNYTPEPWAQLDWDLRGTGNFVFGGTGTGLMVAGAVAGLAGAPVAAFAWPATALIALGLLCVLAKIGRPLRAVNVLFNPFTSWMSREAFLAGPVVLAGAAAGWFGQPWLMVLAAAIAVAFLYCQGRILTASKGIPAWRAPQVLPLVLATGAAEGGGAMLVISGILGAGASAPATVTGGAVLLLGIAARVLTWRAYRRALSGNSPDGTQAALSGAEGTMTGFGHVLPVLLVLAGLLLPGGASALGIAAGLFAMLAGWYMKFVIINRAGFNQGFAIVHTPARGRGEPGPGSKPGWS